MSILGLVHDCSLGWVLGLHCMCVLQCVAMCCSVLQSVSDARVTYYACTIILVKIESNLILCVQSLSLRLPHLPHGIGD